MIKAVSPNSEQLALRRRQLRKHRRLGVVVRMLKPLGVTRWVRYRLKQQAMHVSPGMPLALLDACGFNYPELEVDPALLTTSLRDWCYTPDAGAFNSIDYFSVGGDWQAIVSQPAALQQKPREVELEARSLLAADLVFRDSDAYLRLLAKLKAGQAVRRQGVAIETVAQLDAYFQRFCVLFESIQRNGMLPSSALAGSALQTNLDRPLGVALDQHGQLHRLQGGNHRWAIATVLGITHVPAQLRLVHQSSVAQYG